ncbi:unnamed protein product [Sphagnum balticum]
MRIRKISFAGSMAVGKEVQTATAQINLKQLTLELGGKSPTVVFDDCNLDNAVTWTVNAILAPSGQVCVAESRIYVEKSISKAFIDLTSGWWISWLPSGSAESPALVAVPQVYVCPGCGLWLPSLLDPQLYCLALFQCQMRSIDDSRWYEYFLELKF